MVFIATQEKTGVSSVMAAEDEKCYLSDISYIEDKTSAASGHTVKLDKNDSDKLLTLKVNGEPQVFIKGICAWATSQIVYDLSNNQYDYFTSYLGVDIGRQDTYFNTGVRFYIYTSNDGQNWEEKFKTDTLYGWSEAQFAKVEIKGANYLKLVADSNSPNWWAEWYDEAIYADAKLIKEGYVDDTTSLVPFIKTVEEYDAIIKANEGKEITGDYELAVLQRELVKNADYDVLQAFVRINHENKETLQWLMTDIENIRLYILGGEPDGNYISSLQVLTRLYTTYKEDLDIQERTKHGTVYGELYKKMMITLSLTHSAQVALWMDTTSPENQSDAVARYQIYKDLHKNGKFVVSENQDHTPWFEDLQVEEMRYVLNNIIDDEEILWLNEYTQEYIDKNPGKEEEYLQPHHYMKYIWPDYGRAEFHDMAKKDEWDEKYDFLRYGVTYRPGVYKLWMNIEGGAVCGGISKIGSNIRGVHGTPSSVISQPGHAAIIYYRKDEENNGYWTIDNDVSGWAQSGKTEKLSIRMPLGWGSDSYVDGWAASYIVLAQEALNHYEAYEKSAKMIMTADAYKNNPQKQEKIYRNALTVQSINIDAWYGLIQLYLKDTTKTAEDYYQLAAEICENLKCFPLPMYNLTNLIKPMLTSDADTFRFTILQTKALTEGSTWTDSTAVYQPSITRTVASYLLGQMDTELATFSFDGEDAGKIILSSRYDGNGVHWDYSIDGKKTWNDVVFGADEKHELVLTQEQIDSITAENDIYVHIVGTGYEEANLYKIDIVPQELSDKYYYANDLENRIIGVNLSTEWRYAKSDEWTSYRETSPDLTGDKTVQVRQAATGTMLASEPIFYTFTEDNQPYTRKYVPVSHLSIAEVSSEATANQGSATNAIDGNYNTRWHSDYSGGDTQRYIVIKMDKPIYLSAVEFVPSGGGNGRIIKGTIYGSMEGTTWEELAKNEKDFTYVGNQNADDFGANNIKTFEIENSKEVQYIKIVADSASSAAGGSWFAARMFNIFQDVTKNPHPTAGIGYSTTSPTTEDVVARLVNASTKIRITNNGGSDTYTFTDNDTFTFEFIDDVTGLTGTAKAKVDWIDRIAPTATIEYSTETETEGEVVAKLVPSEEVTVLNMVPNNDNDNNDYTYTFTKNGEFTFEFQDAAGNTGTATATVSWIKVANDAPDADDPRLGELPDDPWVPGAKDAVESDEYVIEEGYILQIPQNTTIREFREKIVSKKDIMVFTDEEGNILEENSIIVTGTIVKLVDHSQYTLIVIADVDSDEKQDPGEQDPGEQEPGGQEPGAQEPGEQEPEGTVESDKYAIKDGYISQVAPKTTYREFVQNMKADQEIVITDKEGNVVEKDSVLMTGMIVKVGSTQYVIGVKGDVNGDGIVDFEDILRINKHRLEKERLEGIHRIAGDVNGDGIVDFEDILQINKYRLEKTDNL